MDTTQLPKQPVKEGDNASFDKEIICGLMMQVMTSFSVILNQESLWVSMNDYCRFHGISPKTVYRAIDEGKITEKNGGLASGSEKPKMRKRLNRLFDIALGRVHIPL